MKTGPARKRGEWKKIGNPTRRRKNGRILWTQHHDTALTSFISSNDQYRYISKIMDFGRNKKNSSYFKSRSIQHENSSVLPFFQNSSIFPFLFPIFFHHSPILSKYFRFPFSPIILPFFRSCVFSCGWARFSPPNQFHTQLNNSKDLLYSSFQARSTTSYCNDCIGKWSWCCMYTYILRPGKKLRRGLFIYPNTFIVSLFVCFIEQGWLIDRGVQRN